MKLYTKRKDLSRAAIEAAQGIVWPVLLLMDFRAVPCFIGMLAGLEMAADKVTFAWFFAAQIAAGVVAALVMAAKAVRRARMPRRCGVIPAETIRRVMGGSR